MQSHTRQPREVYQTNCFACVVVIPELSYLTEFIMTQNVRKTNINTADEKIHLLLLRCNDLLSGAFTMLLRRRPMNVCRPIAFSFHQLAEPETLTRIL